MPPKKRAPPKAKETLEDTEESPVESKKRKKTNEEPEVNGIVTIRNKRTAVKHASEEGEEPAEKKPKQSKKTDTDKTKIKENKKESTKSSEKQKPAKGKVKEAKETVELKPEGEKPSKKATPKEVKIPKGKKAAEAKTEEVEKSKQPKTTKEKETKPTTKRAPKEEKSSQKTEGEKSKPVKKRIVKSKSIEDKEQIDVKKNKTDTDWEIIDFKSDKVNADGNKGNFKITSWNVDGMRAWLSKGGLNILMYDSPDIFCLQETKCDSESIPPAIANYDGYQKFWCSSEKNGYAGVGLLTKKNPLNVTYGIGNKDQDEDGRCITAEFDEFFVVTVYVPNAGKKLVNLERRLKWNELFMDFIKKLDGKKPVIVCGDLNVAHNEIDLANPSTNKKNAGFSQEERDGMTEFLESGFSDSFRALYPDKADCYTFWTYMMGARKKNIGWRLDYFVISERIKNRVCDSVIHKDVFGSDHCPLSLHLNI